MLVLLLLRYYVDWDTDWRKTEKREKFGKQSENVRKIVALCSPNVVCDALTYTQPVVLSIQRWDYDNDNTWVCFGFHSQCSCLAFNIHILCFDSQFFSPKVLRRKEPSGSQTVATLCCRQNIVSCDFLHVRNMFIACQSIGNGRARGSSTVILATRLGIMRTWKFIPYLL